MTVTRVVDMLCRPGEGPARYPDEKRLYWVDIESGRPHRYDPETGAYDCPVEASVIAGVMIQHDGSLLTFMDRGRVGRVVDGDRRESARIVDSPTRLNDAITDFAGRVFCRTMPSDTAGGRLFCLDTDGTVTSVAFGEPDLDSLYVTTAGGDGDGSADEGDESTGDAADALFRLGIAATGRPESRSDVRLE